MCDTVLVKDVVCETVQELADTLSVSINEIVFSKHYSHPLLDGCLCQIDIEATAQKNGYKAETYYDAVADWKLVPNVEFSGGAPLHGAASAGTTG